MAGRALHYHTMGDYKGKSLQRIGCSEDTCSAMVLQGYSGVLSLHLKGCEVSFSEKG